jgi:hypothetical protein
VRSLPFKTKRFIAAVKKTPLRFQPLVRSSPYTGWSVLTSSFNTNWAELFNHRYNLWLQTSESTTGKRGYSYMKWSVWITKTTNTGRTLKLYTPCIMFRQFYWLKSDTFNTLNNYCFSFATTVTRSASRVRLYMYSLSYARTGTGVYLLVVQRNLCYTHRVSTATNSVKKVSKGNLRNFYNSKGQIVWWCWWQHAIQKLTFAKRVRVWKCGSCG